MTARRELWLWLGLGLAAILTSLVLIQISIAAAFDSSRTLDLAGAALTPQVGNYAVDPVVSAQPPLDPSLLTDAPAEDRLVSAAQNVRGELYLPTPQGPINLLGALVTSPTAIPTRLVTALPTGTPLPTRTPLDTATPTDLPPTATASATWTATVTSLPTLTPVVRSTATP